MKCVNRVRSEIRKSSGLDGTRGGENYFMMKDNDDGRVDDRRKTIRCGGAKGEGEQSGNHEK